MKQLTPSQVAEQYVKKVYPCIDQWIDFIEQVSVYTFDYSPVSCLRIASISRVATKTFGYIQTKESQASVIRVARLLSNMQDSAWDTWTAFKAQAKEAAGEREMGVNSIILGGISSFRYWDDALQPTPPFNPPKLLSQMLGGVTP